MNLSIHLSQPARLACYAILVVVSTQAGAQQAAPRIMELDEEGRVSFNRFDIVKLNSGEVLYANPMWSEKLDRPTSMDKIDTFWYTHYQREKGARGIEVKHIAKLTYWESLVEKQLAELVKEDKLTEADLLLAELRRFNSDWGSIDLIDARIQVNKAVQALINRKISIDDGLKQLDRVAKRFSDNEYVRGEVVKLYTQLAESRVNQNYPEHVALMYLQRGESLFLGEGLFDSVRRRWTKQANELIKESESIQRTDRAKAIQFANRVVRLSGDLTLRRRAKVVLRNAEGLIVASYEKSGVFEPFNAVRLMERQVVRLTHDFLMQRNEVATEYGKSGLVRSLDEQQLGTKYAVELETGHRFSDGSPITAADVVRSIELLRDSDGEAYDAEWARFVTGASIANNGVRSLAVNMHPHLRPKSLLYVPIIPRNQFVSMPSRGDPESKNPAVVSGPYKLSSINGNDDVELLSNPNYRRPAQIEKITFRRYVKRGTGHAVNDLMQGRTHLITDPSPAQIVSLANASGQLATRQVFANNVWVLAINHGRGPLGSAHDAGWPGRGRDLRMAIALTIDREGIIKQYFNMLGRAQLKHKVVTGPFPVQSPAYDPSIAARSVDLVSARSLVAKHKQTIQNRRLVLKYSDDGDVVESAMAQIKRELESIGLSIDLQKRPGNRFNKELKLGAFDLAYYQIKHENVLFNIANLFEGPGNFMKYKDQALRQLFVDLRGEKDGRKLFSIQHSIHRYLHTHVIVIPLWQLDSYIAYSRRLSGRGDEGNTYHLPIDAQYVFRDVDRWYLQPAQ